LFNQMLQQYGLDEASCMLQMELLSKIEQATGYTETEMRALFRQLVQKEEIYESFNNILLASRIDASDLKACLQNGADPNVPFTGTTTEKEYSTTFLWNKVKKKIWVLEYPIHVAIRKLDVAAVKLLVEYGSDLDKTNIFGLQPLQLLFRLFEQNAQQSEQTKRDFDAIIKIFKEAGFKTDIDMHEYVNQIPQLPHNLPETIEGIDVVVNLNANMQTGCIPIAQDLQRKLKGMFPQANAANSNNQHITYRSI